MKTQNEIFATEGDNWFKRNKHMLTPEYHDEVTEFCKQNPSLKPQRILEIGCSNGWRLDRLEKLFGSECYGIDTSQEAIDNGHATFPYLHLGRGFSHELPFPDEHFDMIIFGFVLALVDRTKLLASIAEADRVLKNRGHVIIYDFGSRYPYKAKYHHLPKEDIYTYKQSYEDTFLGSNLYSTVYLKEYTEPAGVPLENRNLYKTVVLEKRLDLNYPVL